ncbi:hypothetical protein RJ640_018099 [Escallonia rubra]|uniref:C3H1-type domain-containing protein n=1 Tax=Escallonia rubra TaxID=112253 RepID=A0AA88QBK6_9ASTE|nr:hypothetical protein RJ640_018099 [Escallonia rubra]
MEQELLKQRNTDCVYFLASPLTCKKGIECEYRHSEIARLNPRECWYWLEGSCLNPACAFRHPPLEVHKEEPSESPPQHECSVPVNKTNVPCFFYYNGFCNKGDRCSFLHGHDDNVLISKPKAASPVTNLLEKKLSTANDTLNKKISTASDTLEKKILRGSEASDNKFTGSHPTGDIIFTGYKTRSTPTHRISSGAAKKAAAEAKIVVKQNTDHVAPCDIVEKSASPVMSASESELAAAVRSGSLLPPEGYIQSRSFSGGGQSSEEQVDGHMLEGEECSESSAGLDVLVDDRLENLGYEDDSEYLLSRDTEGRELNGHFMAYEYQEPVEYDPAYPDEGIQYEQEIHDSYDGHLDKEHTYGYMRDIPGHSRRRRSNHVSSRKRKFLPAELVSDGRRGIDLRDHLMKRRMMDGCSETYFSRRHYSPRLSGGSREKPRRQGSWRLNGRLKSVLEINNAGSPSENKILMNGFNQRDRSMGYHVNRSRQLLKGKRQHFHASEVSRKSAFNKRRSTEGPIVFTGPKTLEQIKEEKQKTRENDFYLEKTEHFSRTASENFQAPKPLSEILKDKRGLGAVSS